MSKCNKCDGKGYREGAEELDCESCAGTGNVIHVAASINDDEAGPPPDSGSGGSGQS